MASSQRAAKEELIAQDMKRLHALGYAQELFRAMGGFSNFAISFTIISILSGCVTLFYLIPTTSGFAAASIGWPLVTIFVVIVALGMAELASAYPTAGGLYYWASKLGGPGWGWFTGWFNMIGQFGITAGIVYGSAVTIDVLLHAWLPSIPATAPAFTNGAFVLDAATQWSILLIYAIILVVHATLNIFGVRIVAFLNDISVGWHIVFVALIALAVIIATAASLQFNPGTAGVCCAAQVASSHVVGFNGPGRVFLIDNNFNTTGFPIWYAFLLSLLLATPDLAAAGSFVNPVLYILESRIGYIFGTLLFASIAVAQLFCGMSSVTSNSRMIYAFSRDGAVPFHNVWHRLNSGRTPRNAIILAAAAAFVPAIPTVFNYTAYFAVTSIATIGLYIAYALPILLRFFAKDFKPGPWHLGAWSKPIGAIAVIWVVLISILFMLPTANPINAGNFNYTPVVVLGTFLIIGIWWLAGARVWFKGPIIQGSAEDLAAIERSIGETHVVEGAAGGK